ncbi:tetratricopeptide repeat protein [Rhodohalobacter sp. 614A]|uniref:tetratricopeptide repeat protein n=1 Tax=Rhodohalobacter sp. 614A TaxID=2908649 RepID=UPI001F2A93B6|nr:tetratricopeptide repeat protein [Rhodohalobacter sp. 614A]
MDKKRWNKIVDIVDDILQMDGIIDQDEALKKWCEGDSELKNEVLNLLESIENSSDYWNSLFESNRIFIGDLTQNYGDQRNGHGSLSTHPLPDIESKIPGQIGFYHIQKRIGIGGMGEVYLASRIDEKFHQNVALKLIRHGITSYEQANRFEQERTILSSLNHPNIARLLDGGISSDGRSYYVMEYVDGVPIDKYCKKHGCSLHQRLSLFKQVCRAVQYAHSNFIVHRDLKPDNLLVNKEGIVKILDFGIAKMVDDSLDEQALLQTSVGLRMLSLKYAAPEQITLEPITTATDVYSLGILLYELLTGSHPFDLKGKSLQETEYIIRNHVPDHASSVPGDLQLKLKGDLDAIISKALRKEPSERYESAQNLIEDIERYENSMPVKARRDTVSYKSKKFIRRHSIPLLFTSLIFILVSGFTLFYTYRISQEKQVAELQAQKAEQVTLFLMDMFEANSPSQTGGNNFNVQDMLVRGENEAGKLEGYPELKAQMYEVIGEVYRRLGDYNKSESLLRQSLQIRQDLYGNYHAETVSAFDKLGLLLINKGDFFTADSILTLALDIRENYIHSTGPALAQTLSNLAFATRRIGDNETAEPLYRRSLEIREEHLGPDHPLTLENMNSLGVVLHYKAKYRETEELFREILERRQNLLTPLHPDIAISQNSLGALLMNLGNYEEADSLLKEALFIRKKLYGDNHPSVALTLNNLALSHIEQNRLTEASDYVEEAYRIRKTQLGENHTNTAISKFTMAKLMLKTNQPDFALQLYEDAYQIFRKNLSENHSFTAQSMLGIGSVYMVYEDLETARFYFDEGFSKMNETYNKVSLEYVLASMQYAPFLMETGKNKDAYEILSTASETLKLIENRESERQKYISTLLNRIEQNGT